MVKDVPEGSSALEARIGQPVELAVPGAGTTGFRWEACDTDGLDVERLAARPPQTFGGKTRDVFLVTPRRQGEIKLQLVLRAPWRTEPAEVREVRLKVR